MSQLGFNELGTGWFAQHDSDVRGSLAHSR